MLDKSSPRVARRVARLSVFLLAGFLAVGLLLVTAPLRADTYNWIVPAGDWSNSGNWLDVSNTASVTPPANNDMAYIANDGTATVSQLGATCGTLCLGGGAGSGNVVIAGGGLSAYSNEYLGYSGAAVLSQTDGSNASITGSIYLGYNSGSSGSATVGGTAQWSGATQYIGYFGNGSYTQTGGTNSLFVSYLGYYAGSNGVAVLGGSGQFNSIRQDIGYNGSGVFTQTGGSNCSDMNPAVIYLGNNAGSTGTYNLSGPSILYTSAVYVGNQGTGVFNQSGGTIISHTSGDPGIALGYAPGVVGTYTLSGSGVISIVQDEYVGYNPYQTGATGFFQQTGGSNSTAGLIIGPNGRYQLSGGTLQITRYPGYPWGTFINKGVFDGGNSPATIMASNCTLDLTSGTWQNMGMTTVIMGSNSLLIAPVGFNPSADFAGYSSSGLTHIAGTTLSVPAGMQVTGAFTLSDPVICQGSVIAVSGYMSSSSAINLTGGVTVSGTGCLSLGAGTLTINNAFSGMIGGNVQASNVFIGQGSTGVFSHFDGLFEVVSANVGPGNLYLGYQSGDRGSYTMSGGQLITYGGYRSGQEILGYSGTGSFAHSGGTNSTAQIYLGYNAGSNGTYSMSGPAILSAQNEYVAYNPAATASFAQSGGSNSAGGLYVGPGGCYLLQGGTLAVTSLSSSGTVDGGNGNAVLTLGSSGLADFSNGTLVNTGSLTLIMGANSLLVAPAGFSQGFAPSSSLGVVYTRGNTLTVLPGQGFVADLTITDHVNCQGTIVAVSSINLNSGLTLSGSGVVGLSSGSLTINDAISGMTSGSLGMGTCYVGNAGNGSFAQSGGTNSVRANLYLGYAISDTGSYSLSAGKLFPAAEYIGYSGVGTFVQSGGSNVVGNNSGQIVIYLGYSSRSSGTYNLSGNGLLSAYGGEVVGYTGTGSFVQSGQTTNNAQWLGVGYGTRGCGTYSLSSGQLSAPYEYVGTSGTANMIQSGGTNTIGETLYLGNSGTYNLSGGLLILSGGSGNGVFNFSGGTLRAGDYFTTGLSMTLCASAGGAAFDTAGYSVTLSGSLSGSGGLTKVDSGTLTLSSTNTFSGNTLIDGGKLALGRPLALQNSTLDTSGSGVLSFGSLTSATLGGLAGPGTLSLSNAASAAVALQVGNNASNTTFSGALGGNGSLTKAGRGALLLDGSNSYTGFTIISGGTLQVAGTAALPGYATFGKVSIGSSGMLAVSAGGSGWSAADIGTLLANNNTSFTSGAMLGIDTSVGSLTYAPNISGKIGLAKLGSSSLVLAGTNTYFGPTIVMAGTLQVPDIAALPAFAVPGRVAVASGATLAVSAGDSGWSPTEISSLLAGNGSGFSSGALLGIDTTAGDFSSGSNMTGDMGLAKLGANSLTLSGPNSYTGGTFVTAGTLIATNPEAIQDGTSLTIGANASLLFGGALPAAATAGDVQAVPEPGTVALLAAGALGLIGYGLRKRKAARTAKPAAFD